MRIQFYVYILTTKSNSVLYVGVTNNLKRRLEDHRSGRNHGFTRQYNVHKLVHFETFDTIKSAIKREKNLKAWQRQWKNNLINEKNPNWYDLSSKL